MNRSSLGVEPRQLVSGEEFLQRMRLGDATLWEDLIPLVHRIALGACRDLNVFNELREDVAQDVALRVFTRWESYQLQSSLSTWIYAIARHRCLDELRKRAVRGDSNVGTAEDSDEFHDDHSPHVARYEPSLEQTLCVQQVLAELDAQGPAREGSHRMMDVLLYWVENSPTTEELAQFLQTTLNAAKERKSYILKRIKELCLKFCGHDECAIARGVG
jgi:RNA polymerase sigma factor (sigma-70 family)